MLQGVLCATESVLSSAAPTLGASVPLPLKRAATTALMIATSELFVSIWREGGMFDAIGTLIATVSCAA